MTGSTNYRWRAMRYPLRIDPFKAAHHQQPEISPRRQARPLHFAGMEVLADRFDIFIELLLIEDLIQPLEKRMTRTHRQRRGWRP
jgi:hypothetical protein